VIVDVKDCPTRESRNFEKGYPEKVSKKIPIRLARRLIINDASQGCQMVTLETSAKAGFSKVQLGLSGT